MITSWVRPKQHLAVLIKAAFSRYEAGIEQAGIIEATIPSTSLAPFAPGYVIAILAVGISGFPGRTKQALARMSCVPGHCGACQHRKNECANQSEFRHAFSLSGNLEHRLDVKLPLV